MTDRVVYEVRSKRKGKRKKNAKWQVIFTADGKRHVYLNEALPKDRDGNLIAHPIESVCPKCGYGYSHMMKGAATKCIECAIEELADFGLWLQENWGVELGFRRKSEYTQSEEMARLGIRGVRLSEINKRFGERRLRKPT